MGISKKQQLPPKLRDCSLNIMKDHEHLTMKTELLLQIRYLHKTPETLRKLEIDNVCMDNYTWCMNEKLSLLHQASELLKKDNHTDLADELTELVEDLLTNLNNEETTAIEVSKQAIETFLETNKELLQKHEELTNITNRKSDLAALQGSIKEEESADEKSPSRSRRDRRGKTATKIAA